MSDRNDELDAEEARERLEAAASALPDAMAELHQAMQRFPEVLARSESAETPIPPEMESLLGEPDWRVTATVRVEEMLVVEVVADFDLRKTIQTWRYIRSGRLEAMLGGGDEGRSRDEASMRKVLDDLQQGRGLAVVREIHVERCELPGAPETAAEEIRFTPEMNVPLLMHQNGLGFEFAPVLTIRNQWEKAIVPAFFPMGEEVVVPLSRFQSGQPFTVRVSPEGQEYDVKLALHFAPLDTENRAE